MTTETFPPGTLVKARGREWVVLPESEGDVVMVRPIGGVDDEVVGISRTIEQIESASFSLPNPSMAGDFNSCRMLRDAARLSTRSATGPFRSFGKIAVEPRPYQLVPLLMAMRLDPVRMLIADGVGIGKTVEACLIAKELIERGEITRLAVLTPPHLAEQWQKELSEKFHIEAELLLSSTARRLERGLRAHESVYQRYPFLVISIDYVKSTRHRHDFINQCPEMVIVDEAHTCTLAGGVGKSRQARHDLLKDLAKDEDRNLILVTATPHSGNEDAFRSLLSLIEPEFANLPPDLESDTRKKVRERLSRHLVQRLRANVLDFDKKLGIKTSFPEREDAEQSYKLSKEYKALFKKVHKFAGELVSDESGSGQQKRVRWWSALALLRAIASSPAAAAATLRSRAFNLDEELTEEEAEDKACDIILDRAESETVEAIDFTPGVDTSDDSNSPASQRLRRLAVEAEELFGTKGDSKLKKAQSMVKDLVKDGFNPIVFCRFIDTAEYVAEQLRGKLGKEVEVTAITGQIPPKEREDRIAELGKHPQRVLICTDCLSEGINLQDHFDAVLHYDLSWNPTRHDQREGRVDRFGQASPKVRVINFFGQDNQIDGVVLEVLLRKHKKIKSELGVSVAVPGNSEAVMKALFEGMELRSGDLSEQLVLPGFDTVKDELHQKWENARDKEKKSRSKFAQLSIKTEEVYEQLQSIQTAIGTGPALQRFVTDVFHLAGVPVSDKKDGSMEVNISTGETNRSLRHAIGFDSSFRARFDLPVEDNVYYLARTSPIVEGLSAYTLETALDEVQSESERPIARRCGVTQTESVNEKTSLLLVRFRFHLMIHQRGEESTRPLLAEEVRSIAFTGSPEDPNWLDDDAAENLLSALPAGNVNSLIVKQQLEHLLGPSGQPHLGALEKHLLQPIEAIADERARLLANAHAKVRKSAKLTGKPGCSPVDTADVLGCFILLPETNG